MHSCLLRDRDQLGQHHPTLSLEWDIWSIFSGQKSLSVGLEGRLKSWETCEGMIGPQDWRGGEFFFEGHHWTGSLSCLSRRPQRQTNWFGAPILLKQIDLQWGQSETIVFNPVIRSLLDPHLQCHSSSNIPHIKPESRLSNILDFGTCSSREVSSQGFNDTLPSQLIHMNVTSPK